MQNMRTLFSNKYKVPSLNLKPKTFVFNKDFLKNFKIL